ncbi:hypothetical protein JVT61DRAFT_6352 [Boletus reticuloceps]|uniref:Uncharacterized protein n=1 Tax=Boletus reticuloceps TaxID=495285 RepID=A0A8I3A6T3_9AGAM|nr:hypothetical protein JVT61DRAFT_6352 [Boletus reticuloceps]
MSLSDISDLTDLSTDVDEPLAKRTSKVKKAAKEYKITNVLRAPRTAQYTAKSLYDQIIDNSIDLDPDYQRGKPFACGVIAGIIAGSDGADFKKT